MAKAAGADASVSARIDQLLADQGDWRGELLSHLRGLIRKADPDVEEDLKWSKPSNPAGVPTWSHAGLICTGEIYKDKVKLSFFEGASLADPKHVFNASLDAGSRRCVDLYEGDRVDAKAFAALIKAAVQHNVDKAAAKRSK